MSFINHMRYSSKMRRIYITKLIFRIAILFICIASYVNNSQVFSILIGINFFERLSPLHVLWVIWAADMLFQIIPIKHNIPLGSQKLFRLHFTPSELKTDRQQLKKHAVSSTKSAYKVFFLWSALTAIIGILFHNGIIDYRFLFIISVFFYVCDLICVLIWCPFRLMMGNRCCTTCRIFNWDHLMMFSPLIFLKGFYPISLVAMSVLVWAIWELKFLLYPERFWDRTNDALKCSNCTDKLCIQYCKKV